VKIRSVWLTRFIGWFAATGAKLLFRTYRFTRHLETPAIDPSRFTSRMYAYSLWHDEIFFLLSRLYVAPPAPCAALVSRHQDGSYLTEFMRHMHVRGVRGSTNHGGDQALRELVRAAACNHIFITPDGPRGPHHKVKEGIVFLASQTGLPIVPVGAWTDRCWLIKGSWTNQIIPKPFARVHCVLGTPVVVPPGLDRSGVADWTVRVQAEMDRLHDLARELGEARAQPLAPSATGAASPTTRRAA
jgi:lysophospholipid acyltransferase (LPLAT)-like uncharacterized protein